MVHCLNGTLLAASIAIALSVPVPLTPSLIAASAILFGPLFGLAVSSVHTRIQTAVARRLGGVASFGDIYKLLAWSVLPLGLGALISSLLLRQFHWLGWPAAAAAGITLLLFLFCSMRTYWVNVLAAQELSRARCAASLAITFTLFTGLIAVCMAFILLVFGYGVNKDPAGLMLLFGLTSSF
jgi:hypothetical protein